MKALCVYVFLACWVFVNASNSPWQELPVELLKLNTPSTLAQELQHQLARNDSRALLSRSCFEHVIQYIIGLQNGELWASQMFDANAKFPSGFLRLALGSLGAFDQCLKIKGENAVGTVRGKYCLGELRLLNMDIIGRQAVNTRTDIDRPGQTRWVNFREGFASVPWGICLPDACSAKDFQFLHFIFFLTFTEETCQTLETQTTHFDDADFAAIIFFGIIAAIMVASTLYDAYIYYFREGQGVALLRSFSVATNTLKIITVKQDEDEISCIHGMKVITTFTILAGLRYATYLLAPLKNWLDVLNFWLTAIEYVELIIVVDTFFVVSGMFISYGYFKNRSERGSFNVLAFYLNRILRLTPALAAIVLVHCTLLRHIGTGPVWTKIRDQYLVNNCREYWWASLLYIQNYVNPSVTLLCVLQSWQLSVDMQLFLLSPLILIPLSRAPKYTMWVVGSLLFGSMLSPFLATWAYGLKAVIMSNRSLHDLRRYLKHFYFPTHTRASAWIIGFILGYLLFEYRRRKPKIPITKVYRIIIAVALWVVAFVIMVTCILVGREFKGQEYNWFLQALHMAFMRPLWAVAMCWVIFACASGYGGLINSFLSLPFFRVLSRISYGTYLVFLTVFFTVSFQTRTPLDFTHVDVWNKVFGDFMFCYGLGFLWTLAFESPFVAISKVLFGKTRKS